MKIAQSAKGRGGGEYMGCWLKHLADYKQPEEA